MSTKTKDVNPEKRGKRYTEKEKNEILAFIQNFNHENRRGGQTAAAKKYGISPISLSQWNKKLNSAAEEGPKKRGPKPNSAKHTSTVEGSPNFSKKLSQLAALADDIDRKALELGKLKAEFEKLKKAL